MELLIMPIRCSLERKEFHKRLAEIARSVGLVPNDTVKDTEDEVFDLGGQLIDALAMGQLEVAKKPNYAPELLEMLEEVVLRYKHLEEVYAKDLGIIYDAPNGTIQRAEKLISHCERRK